MIESSHRPVDEFANRIIHGDALEVCASLPARVINLVVTSPPYADQRAHTYGGVAPGEYVEWFLPIADEIQRVLTEDGSFILSCSGAAFAPVHRGRISLHRHNRIP